MYCNNCGHELRDGVGFCGYCGAKQQVPTPQPTQAQPTQPQEQMAQQPQAFQDPQYGYTVSNQNYGQPLAQNNTLGSLFSGGVHSKQDLLKYFALGGIALIIINLIFSFLPFVEVYQPSYKKTSPLLGIVTYEGWHTDTASMVSFIIPIFLTIIPYTIELSLLGYSFRKKLNYGGFAKIINDRIDKPIRFISSIIGAAFNIIVMPIIFALINSEIEGDLKEAGAYCKMTVVGIMSIITSVLLIVLLIVLSVMAKKTYTTVNRTQYYQQTSQYWSES